ncbi:LNS2-domain-containing protein [Dichomitus squalens]|uniref:phosphatidate phosphatase n=1 Tax=Dichomitus squalens TaxID=114155 RepID=A0A4Q9NZ89_9APHY|nr:LNS2-domain-containing protein [Dichomitus squalens]TBU63172.1 LNS2-domain-containing protein [Dichomitus squalens]
MNYLRGAVSAISAPYQYYKDLNPSTLTGAIDVIVVRRPRNLPDKPPDGPVPPLSDEETELVCSPFHVRFGKWQVLRPQDKKVDVFVNGQLVPFSMKIGEAGEAFFVFETEEEIPENLATSPILQATRPGETNMQARETGRFGAGPASPQIKDSAGEPEFLDLNATAGTQSRQSTPSPPHSPESSQDEETKGPGILARTAQIGTAIVSAARETEKAEEDKLKDKTVMEALKETNKDQREFVKDKATAAYAAAERAAAVNFPSTKEKGDEVLPEPEVDEQGPDVKYTDTMVFDMEGYHAADHGRQASDATLRSSTTHRRGSSASDTSSQNRTPGPSRTPSPPGTPLSVPFPTARATSEPPPQHEDGYASITSPQRAPFPTIARDLPDNDNRPHIPSLPSIRTSTTEEYTWDWGNFPQKTPVRSTFAHSHAPGTSVDLTRKGKGRMMSELPDAQYARARAVAEREAQDDSTSYGVGGRLTIDHNDPTRFRVFIEGRAMEFELAVVPPTSLQSSVDGKEHAGTLGGDDEVEDEHRFEQSKIDFERFLGDESVVHDDNLVLLWGDKYIRRRDGSPLMDALITWRQAALRDQQSLFSSRPASPSPLSEDESVKSEGDEPAEERRPQRAKTDTALAVDGSGKEPAPTSSSWVRWWSRSRRGETARPEIGHTNSEPSAVPQQAQSNAILRPEAVVQRTSTSASAPVPAVQDDAESRSRTRSISPELHKRFAKTLRLTSDQLKSLHLKPGANSVTFSLSSTGVAACSARLFVWEWTDQIVISDIDGTITKSDALGHVFTMIGRDWTHLGVAKLYTDICRNGYKILYLTSRAIGQADSTREYLKGIKQNNYQLPEGPVIMSPDRLMASLHREVIMRKPEVFKMACLRDIQKLFGGPIHNPFYAGFGNRITDALSYRSVSVPSSRIFTIDSTGEVKMELLELAGYKSSYIHMTDLVDQMFPPINRKMAAEFTDFNYWRTPIQDFPLPDLSPPSPALSARSDTSNQSTFARLRNFSLVSSRQPSSKSFTLPPPATEASQQKNDTDGNEARLRQMSSFERLSNTFASLTQSSSSTAGSPHSSTPTLHDSDSEYDEEADDVEKARRRRQRRQSVASMPGSLPGSNPGSDDEMTFGDDEEDDEEGDGYEGENEVVPDEAFDDAIFAAGEMKNVDYI